MWYQHGLDFFPPVTPICGERFRQFLDVCWPYVDYFTFAGPATNYDDSCLLKDALHPWFDSVVTLSERFGYGPGSTPDRIYRYRATAGAKEAILACYSDIFFRKRSPTGLGGYPKEEGSLFCDLCLYSDKKLFFGSISHEGECFLWPLSEEMRQALVENEDWGVCKWKDEWSRHSLDEYAWCGFGKPEKIKRAEQVLTIKSVVLACTFVKELAAFYSQLLDWPVVEESPERVVVQAPETGIQLVIAYAEDYIPPVYPSQPERQQMMMRLDFCVNKHDYPETVGHAEVLGAQIVEEQIAEQGNWAVLLDPAGHPFSISERN